MENQDKAFKVTFGDGSALCVFAQLHEEAKFRAQLQGWKVCGYWPTVIAVEALKK
jgi:hypothetical protein